MGVHTAEIAVQSHGNGHTLDITPQVNRAVVGSGFTNGVVTVFCPGSTGGLTTIEFEPGVVADLQRLFDELAPANRDYRHQQAWGDDNGHSHVRAGLLGPSLTIPFVSGRLTLGTWQQVVFVDFDSRARDRRLVAQVMGE